MRSKNKDDFSKQSASKIVNNKKCAPKLIFFSEKKLRKIRIMLLKKSYIALHVIY